MVAILALVGIVIVVTSHIREEVTTVITIEQEQALPVITIDQDYSHLTGIRRRINDHLISEPDVALTTEAHLQTLRALKVIDLFLLE